MIHVDDISGAIKIGIAITFLAGVAFAAVVGGIIWAVI